MNTLYQTEYIYIEKTHKCTYYMYYVRHYFISSNLSIFNYDLNTLICHLYGWKQEE